MISCDVVGTMYYVTCGDNNCKLGTMNIYIKGYCNIDELSYHMYLDRDVVIGTMVLVLGYVVVHL